MSPSKAESRTSNIRVSGISEEPVALIGSFFNGMSVPPSTEFDLYKHKKNDTFILHGENDTLDYNGESVKNSENDYIVGVYDPIHKSVELYKAPFLSAKVTAKRHRVYKGPAIKQAGVRNVTQRNALGEAFGTKKAKAAISSLERNRIDADKLQDLEMDIIDSVTESTQDLPSREKMAQEVVHDRPTPLANVDAKSVEDVYPIFNIIPKKEWAYLRVNSLLTETDEKKQLEMLPYSKSQYIKKHLPTIIQQNNTEKLQLLYYASLLFGVYENRRVKDKQSLMTRLQNKASEVLVDGILERFAISRASQFGKSKDRSFSIDPQNEDKLLCYLLTIILHIDNFVVELPPLANELNMKPTRLVGLFKALGAIIKSATVGEAEAFGIPKSAAGTYKIATLRVPFKLPEMTRRGKRSR
ncbi:RPA49 [[Candida] subhashii]|uniref:RPA49 n=1 Tax=[Candida] subhashii TaxID=561895 RepID=A0A8J5QQ88_9ASCO|nr:RPA49 [[Candida] subhashii]KAG7664706.1 RPA49 [[Candida] subhashii]